MMLDVFIPGTPGAKGRPRFTRQGRAYTPSKTLKYESYLRAMLADAMERPPTAEPVSVSLEFCMPEPKSMRKRDQGKMLPHTKRPDVDNLMKAVLDAANSIVFDDDSQICVLVACKRYDAAPGVRIVVRDIDASMSLRMS